MRWLRRQREESGVSRERLRDQEARLATDHEKVKETWTRTVSALERVELLKAEVDLLSRGRET